MKFEKKDFVPFSESEIQKDGNGKYVLHPPISPRENYLRALYREEPMWIPQRSDCVNFTPSIYPDNVARAFVIEAQPYPGEKGGKDIFGIPWTYIPVAGGSMVAPGTPPLLEEVSQWREKVVFPDIDQWDWAGSAEANKPFFEANKDKVIITWIFNGMFERLISFMEFENAAMALIDEDEQEDVKALFQALTDFYKKLIDHFVKYYPIDGIYMHDDWGAQQSPFFSIDTCREMLVPYLKQITEHCHKHGLFYDFHCCGKSEDLAPCMIEAGMDAWCGQPLNDKLKLWKTYGDKLFIGVHSPYGPAHQAPEDDAEIAETVERFMEPYKDFAPQRPFFIQDLRPTDRTRAAFYRYGRKLLTQAKKA